ncbi:unnamed protein product [Rhizoctonia solani]|uniref:Uncharacterized protein n=1 Tax=Rhizoctonia solani TaxID=456999 RepID=A0A8H3GTN0_9AGAM|nr:unnamed protein product [Rhizoctonia solani]
MDLRFFVDTLIAYSCEVDTDGLSHYFPDRTLRLPNWVKVATVTVDGIVAIPITAGPYVSNFHLQVAANAFVGTPEPRDVALIHCVAAFRSIENGETQMKMAMVSALHQKKVLGLQQQLVFGIFQLRVDFLQVNAGCWISDKIKIYEVGSYSTRSPTSLVQFYFVLQGMRQLASQYKEELTNSTLTLMEAIHIKIPVNEWAPTVSEESNNSGHSGEEELIIRPGISQALASLGKWDVDDRINTFCRNIGSGNSDSGDDLDIA